MSKPKKSFVKKIKRKKTNEWDTIFHLSVSSKALFNLSPEAFQLYLVLLLHGKGKFISTRTLANRMKKSERSIQRYRDELKDKGFLRVIMIEPKKFQYLFDYKGLLKETIKNKEIEKEIIKEKADEVIIEYEEEEETLDEQSLYIIEKTKAIKDYADFAILENKFWTLDEITKAEIIKVLKSRVIKEPETREAIEWFLDKTNI